MRATAKRLLERVLAGTGYVLKESESPPRGLALAAKHLAEIGFRPNTIIDVGVGNGTPWLYDAFPAAHFELFEALDCFIPAMERICNQFSAAYHLCALGAEPGQATIEVDPKVPTGSTMAGRLSKPWKPDATVSARTSERRVVSVRTLDEFAPFPGPILLKLDVEGFECEVLKGAATTLSQREIIISEISVIRRHQREVSFGSFVHFLETLGFSLIDIAEMLPTERNGPLAYIDAIFARSHSTYCTGG